MLINIAFKVVNCHEGDFIVCFETLICISIAYWGGKKSKTKSVHEYQLRSAMNHSCRARQMLVGTLFLKVSLPFSFMALL